MNQLAVVELADAQLERRISEKKRELERETSPVRKRKVLREFEELIRQRSPLQVRKMERERGLLG